MNNLPELSYDEARSIIEKNILQTFPSDEFNSLHVSLLAARMATVLISSRSSKISDEVFRKAIEDIINPNGLTPEPEAGITLPPGSVRDHPANDAHNVAAAVIEAKGAL